MHKMLCLFYSTLYEMLCIAIQHWITTREGENGWTGTLHHIIAHRARSHTLTGESRYTIYSVWYIVIELYIVPIQRLGSKPLCNHYIYNHYISCLKRLGNTISRTPSPVPFQAQKSEDRRSKCILHHKATESKIFSRIIKQIWAE